MIMYFNKWGWLFDRERRAVNREVLKGMEFQKKMRATALNILLPKMKELYLLCFLPLPAD